MDGVGPRAAYKAALAANEIQADPAQRLAVELLQARAEQLMSRRFRFPGARLLRGGNEIPRRGIYFWGGVGRGKTWLMDLFFDSLPLSDKLRLHFHRFMYLVHGELGRLQGEKDPLRKVAMRMAGTARVLCFDEFFVSDITDAMLLHGLLDTLLRQGVMLLATSNVPPERLYEDGLQRSKFLPAIDLLQRATEVVQLDGGVDYRLRALTGVKLYHHPLGEAAEAALGAGFGEVCPGFLQRPDLGRGNTSIEILGRKIPCAWSGAGAAWFDFDDICEGPRSQNDYMEIARFHHTVVVSRVPQLHGHRDNAARRFISLVDEFYDRNIKLMISAETGVDELYIGTRLAFEFARTVSRLKEMQSAEYLARPHKP